MAHEGNAGMRLDWRPDKQRRWPACASLAPADALNASFLHSELRGPAGVQPTPRGSIVLPHQQPTLPMRCRLSAKTSGTSRSLARDTSAVAGLSAPPPPPLAPWLPTATPAAAPAESAPPCTPPAAPSASAAAAAAAAGSSGSSMLAILGARSTSLARRVLTAFSTCG